MEFVRLNLGFTSKLREDRERLFVSAINVPSRFMGCRFISATVINCHVHIWITVYNIEAFLFNIFHF